ncbi:hypothetical protein SK128_016925 [Halocaridina rubra]|uniref:Uncharacterized protein n=1 Tax=Halocaridina rubra TaxID=373956 RepID=A0AAN9A2H3_HALRR
MVDACGAGWEEKPRDDAHCIARALWSIPNIPKHWESHGPLQVGGLAQSSTKREDYGWGEAPTRSAFSGCISHLNINDQLVDLGEVAYSKGSVPGCPMQESACAGGLGSCGIRGTCTGGLKTPTCECDSGWSAPKCDTPTVPSTLTTQSYMKMALSFTPPSEVVTVQMRVRTNGVRTGMLLHLAAQHTQHSFTLHLRASVACASVSGAGWAARIACAEGRPIGDGKWHTIRAERRGHSITIDVDDGDEWRHNHSFPSLTAWRENHGDVRGPPMPLEIDKHDGVTIGGLPKFIGVKLVTVGDDLHDSK